MIQVQRLVIHASQRFRGQIYVTHQSGLTRLHHCRVTSACTVFRLSRWQCARTCALHARLQLEAACWRAGLPCASEPERAGDATGYSSASSPDVDKNNRTSSGGETNSPERARLPTATADRAPGDVILDRYTIERTLGDGSSGTTYAARDSETDARVAVKELALGRLKSWKQLDLFEREAQTLRGLSHPSIPRYLDYQQAEGCFFLVQELVDGPTLAQLMAGRSRVDDAAVTRIARDLLETLAYLSSCRCVPRPRSRSCCLDCCLYLCRDYRSAACKAFLRQSTQQEFATMTAPSLSNLARCMCFNQASCCCAQSWRREQQESPCARTKPGRASPSAASHAVPALLLCAR